MARTANYYDIDSPRDPAWEFVDFPGADHDEIPDSLGVYRFVCTQDGDSQTMYVESAPDDYGDTIQECYVEHCSLRLDPDSAFYELYCRQDVHFEHFACGNKVAQKHKHKIVANLKPFYNTVVKYKVSGVPAADPFKH